MSMSGRKSRDAAAETVSGIDIPRLDRPGVRPHAYQIGPITAADNRSKRHRPLNIMSVETVASGSRGRLPAQRFAQFDARTRHLVEAPITPTLLRLAAPNLRNKVTPRATQWSENRVIPAARVFLARTASLPLGTPFCLL